MITKNKNRVTIFFDKEHTQSFRVFLHTLEQANIFIMLIKRCTDLKHIGYTQEVCKDTEWKLINAQDFDTSEDFVKSRNNAAPYCVKVKIHKKNAEDFIFEAYFFSSLDTDYFVHLLRNGARSNTVEFSTFVRDRKTHEWCDYVWGDSIPHDVAADYLALSPENKVKANDVIVKLTRV